MSPIAVRRAPARASTRVGTIAVLTTIFMSMLVVPLATPASAALTGPVYPPPGGVTLTSSGTTTSHGRACGATWQYQSFDLPRFSHIYWGVSSIDMPKLSLDGTVAHEAGETLSFDAANSNLPAGINRWSGTANIRTASGGGYVTTPLPTRLTLTATRLNNSAIAFVDASSVGVPAAARAVLTVEGDYKVHRIFEAFHAGIWKPAIDLFDSLQTDPNTRVITSISGGFYHNQIPTVTSAALATDEDTPLAVTLGASDGDGNALVYTLLTEPTNGTLTGSAPNLLYTPGANYFGPDSLSFKVNDGLADSGVATVDITVGSVNDVPVAFDGAAVTDEDVPVEIVLSGADPVEGSELTYSIVDQPDAGSLAGAGNVYVYTPGPHYNGADQFRFLVNDGTDDSNIAVVELTIDGVNDAPVAADDGFATPQYTPVTFDVLQNDTDVENNTLTVTAVTQPTDGSVTIEPEGTLTFRPSSKFKGSTTFTYTIDDGLGGTDDASVTISEIGCGEDGLAQLEGTPADGGASETIDKTVEPLAGDVDEGLAESVHDFNCGTVVPLENTLEG